MKRHIRSIHGKRKNQNEFATRKLMNIAENYIRLVASLEINGSIIKKRLTCVSILTTAITNLQN